MTILFVLPVFLLCLCAGYTFYRDRQISGELKPDGRFAIIDGTNIHYRFYPASEDNADRPVIVFLHGASGNGYDTELAFLEPMRRRNALLFVDRPGLGYSQTDFTEDALLRQAGLIAGLLETLGLEDVVVAGHSLGGAVTAALGLAAPDRVKGMAFIAPVSHPWPGGVTWYYSVAALPLIGPLFCWTLTLPIAERLVPKAIESVFFPDVAPENYASKIRASLLFRPSAFRGNARQIAGLKKSVTEQSKLYPSMPQPALVVTGTRDTVVWPSIHCEGLLRDLPNAELLVLDGAGHMPHHTHTGEIAAALERLIGRIEAADGKTGGKLPLPDLVEHA